MLLMPGQGKASGDACRIQLWCYVLLSVSGWHKAWCVVCLLDMKYLSIVSAGRADKRLCMLGPNVHDSHSAGWHAVAVAGVRLQTARRRMLQLTDRHMCTRSQRSQLVVATLAHPVTG